MTNVYAYWQSALAGKKPVATVDEPQPGFYRKRQNGGWIPVAVWPKRNGLAGAEGLGFKIGKEVVGHNMGVELWSHYCQYPITEDTYRAVAELGKQWPDADPVVAAMIDKPAVRTPGVSNPAADAEMAKVFPMVDPTTEFREQIATAKSGMAPYAKIEADEASVRAASLRNMFLKIAKDADTARETEKRPHLDAGKAVDAKWQPIVREAQSAAQTLRTAMEDWETVKRKAAQEATARQQEVERRAAAENRPAPPPPPPNMPAPAPQVRPTYGKAASVGTRMVVTGIDADKLLLALKARAEWGEVETFLMELAQKLAGKGIILPGVTTEERASIR